MLISRQLGRYQPNWPLPALRPLPTPHTLRVTTDIPGLYRLPGQRNASRTRGALTYLTIGERLFDRSQDTPTRSISIPLAGNGRTWRPCIHGGIVFAASRCNWSGHREAQNLGAVAQKQNNAYGLYLLH